MENAIIALVALLIVAIVFVIVLISVINTAVKGQEELQKSVDGLTLERDGLKRQVVLHQCLELSIMGSIGKISREMNMTEPKRWNASMGRGFRQQLDIIVINLSYGFPEVGEAWYQELLNYFQPSAIANTLHVWSSVHERVISEPSPFRNAILAYAAQARLPGVERASAE